MEIWEYKWRSCSQCKSDSLCTERSTAQRSRHDTSNHLKGASPSQQQAEKANSGEDEGPNSSIEQLKCLLAPEFLKQQQPDSKLEKADILEMMTLNFQLTCCQSRLLQVCA
ncbi:hypothetical protein ABG768_003964 [Culter alburnus]|uniref:Uncharacterized protein n=1 Tax=Culter alburnus TaxID=194366 RepID=A0AAW2A2Z1_CULAL